MMYGNNFKRLCLNLPIPVFQCAAVAITVWQIVEEIREFRRSNESHDVSLIPAHQAQRL